MATYRVQLADGRTVRIEAASPEAADMAAGEYVRANPLPGTRGTPGYAKARARFREEQEAADKRKFKPIGENFGRRIAGSTGALDEVAGGLVYARQGAENLFRRATGKPIETTAGEAGLAAQDNEREWQAAYARQNPIKNIFASGLGIAASGRPTGGAAFTNPFQAGAAVAAQNAPFAVARQQGTLKERLPGAATETALAFGTGAALTAAGNRLAASAARRRAAPISPQRRLSQEGVQLTPGQMIGGAAQRTEDAMTSVPVLGDAIRDARIRGVESFDRAAVNRTLAPVGKSLPSNATMGRGAIGEAERAISDSYDDALKNIVVQPDSQFGQDITRALNARPLGADAAQEVDAVLSNIADRAKGPMDGNLWKELDSELRAAIDAAGNASGSKPSMRAAAQTLKDVREAFRGVLERSAPGARQAVGAADEATANLARIRQASQYTGTAGRGGMFSPADLNRAVQTLDSSANNRAYARGDALMQDLTDPAMEVLPSTVPDSGTPIRSVLMTLGGLGGGAAGGQALGIGAAPEAMATIGGVTVAASALYSRPVQTALNAIYRATTPGAAQEGLSRLAQLAARDPALVPVYEQAARALGVPLPGNGNQPPTPEALPAPTRP